MGRSKERKEVSELSNQVPKAVISRLSLYLRELQRIQRTGQETVSSTQLGMFLGFTDAQVRKDLAYFGQFGYPGIGYRCDELIQAIREILGTSQPWHVALIGLGNLGRALLGYRGFRTQGFSIVATFDIDESVIGSEIEGVPVHHLDQLKAVVTREQIRLAMLAVPAQAAQAVTRQIIEAGIDGILNFAPVTVTMPENVSVVGVDLAIELEQLTFSVLRQR